MIRLVIFFLFILNLMSCSNNCENTVYEIMHSLDRNYKAIIYLRRCDVTPELSTHLLIQPMTDKFRKQSGNIVIMQGTPVETEPTVEWLSNTEITISFNNPSKIYKKESKYLNIKINYSF